jgi:1,4-dihydroxy-2-naphthoate polyprenyltransferase
MKHWISAARPRTLPLALSSILMGSFLAATTHQFDWTIFALASLTTIFLQVLSNFANDYGDTANGIDTADRTVATRAVQTGAITPKQMKNAIILCGILSFITGCMLLYVALRMVSMQTILAFLGIGLLAIVAAITYTVGKRPYGYVGLGDLSVLIFFGWVGVLGTYYLYTQTFSVALLLPATACGAFAVGVLNINNIRDIENDQRNGKYSIPVRLGKEKATQYHWLLLMGGFLCAVIYVLIHFETWTQWIFLVTLPLLIKIGKGVQNGKTPAEIDPYLKRMALTTLLFVITFGIGQLL